MQTIRIVISGGKTQSVEITEAKKPKATDEVMKILSSMPKKLLTEALSIKDERQGVKHEYST